MHNYGIQNKFGPLFRTAGLLLHLLLHVNNHGTYSWWRSVGSYIHNSICWPNLLGQAIADETDSHFRLTVIDGFINLLILLRYYANWCYLVHFISSLGIIARFHNDILLLQTLNNYTCIRVCRKACCMSVHN
jgi:hypothetical protein